MLNQHPKKHRHAGTPNVVRDPLVDPGNPSHRYQARSTAHLDRPRSRMVALAASPPGPRSPRSPQAENATVVLVVRQAWPLALTRTAPFGPWLLLQTNLLTLGVFRNLSTRRGTDLLEWLAEAAERHQAGDDESFRNDRDPGSECVMRRAARWRVI